MKSIYTSKENPFFILNPTTYTEKLNSRNWYKFNCIRCNAITIKKGNANKTLTDSYFMCKKCAKEAAAIKYKDWYNNLSEAEKDEFKNKASLSEEQKLKHKENIRRYFNNESIIDKTARMEKARQTLIDKYGVTNPGQISTVRERIKEHWKNIDKKAYAEKCRHDQLNRPYEDKIASIKKANSTKLERFGALNCVIRYIYNKLSFDSSWELAFYIYYIDMGVPITRSPTILNYEYNNKLYNYIPDFSINNILYEIKGDQFFNEQGILFNPFNSEDSERYHAKYYCMVQNNVVIIKYKQIKFYLDYIDTKYGKDYLKQFRRK